MKYSLCARNFLVANAIAENSSLIKMQHNRVFYEFLAFIGTNLAFPGQQNQAVNFLKLRNRTDFFLQLTSNNLSKGRIDRIHNSLLHPRLSARPIQRLGDSDIKKGTARIVVLPNCRYGTYRYPVCLDISLLKELRQ